jgi:hypothetical protein
MTAVTTSLSTNYSTTRDTIIARALRICGTIGQGETPSAVAVTETAEALNDLVKQLATDGMPLWKVKVMTAFAFTATQTYNIGIGSTVNQTAPLKVIQAWTRDNTVASLPLDSPMLVVTNQDYNFMGSKLATGRPNQVWYNPPGAGIITVSDLVGVLTVYPLPDANSITNLTCVLVAHLPFDDFDASTDIPDFPSYWYNAIKWLLAADIAYENGVGLAERSMIAKRADAHKQAALSFGSEEGSMFLRPTVQYQGVGGGNY